MSALHDPVPPAADVRQGVSSTHDSLDTPAEPAFDIAALARRDKIARVGDGRQLRGGLGSSASEFIRRRGGS